MYAAPLIIRRPKARLNGGIRRSKIEAFVTYYNYQRYRESINNLNPADVCLSRAEAILAERAKIKRTTIANSRLQHQLQAAKTLTKMRESLHSKMPRLSQIV